MENSSSEKSHQSLALKRVCTTRWSSRSVALDTVLKIHESVINTLNKIQTEEAW